MTQRLEGIAHFIDARLERIIIDALRRYETNGFWEDEDRELAKDFANALENDTSLCETTATRDDEEEA